MLRIEVVGKRKTHTSDDQQHISEKYCGAAQATDVHCVLDSEGYSHTLTICSEKVNQSHFRPEVPRGFQEVKVTMAQNGGKIVNFRHRPPLPPGKCSWYSFLLEAESTPGQQCDRKDYVNEKFAMTPSGIEPATFRFVAQRLNHCATAVPPNI